MPRKPKFRPRITRVKLNPEQAVLTCECYVTGYVDSDEGIFSTGTHCARPERGKGFVTYKYISPGTVSS